MLGNRVKVEKLQVDMKRTKEMLNMKKFQEYKKKQSSAFNS